MSPPLIDSFQRVHRSLRVSVTDRCNIRCQYCMSDGPLRFMPRHFLLSYEQIARFVDVAAGLGICKVRLTGGEPLVRRDLAELVAKLKRISTLHEVALTTNGMLLAEQIGELKAAGLDRINISLDTLRHDTFERISRRTGLELVLQGIDAALEAGYQPRLNSVMLRDLNGDEAVELVAFATARKLTIRFIEFMPLDADREWGEERMVSGSDLRATLRAQFGTLEPINETATAQPSKDYRVVATGGIVGFIDTVTQPFCGVCDRLRLTAEGKIRNCLFGQEEWDVKRILDKELETNVERDELERVLRTAVFAKHASHGIQQEGFEPPVRAMYQIGG